jgi:hypothetical protein
VGIRVKRLYVPLFEAKFSHRDIFHGHFEAWEVLYFLINHPDFPPIIDAFFRRLRSVFFNHLIRHKFHVSR